MDTAMRKKTKGFTLAELLIAVAIIAVLVAVCIPIFSNQLEKSRRAVDMSNARNMQSVLMNSYAGGTIVFPVSYDSGNKVTTYVAVIVNSDGMTFRASGTVKINGNDWHWDRSNGGDYARVKQLFESCGCDNLKVMAKNTSDGGWASYGVVLFSDGSCRVFSSAEKMEPGASTAGVFESYLEGVLATEQTDIEKAMGG